MDYTETATHISEAELNNSNISERLRFSYDNFPYQNISKTIIKHLAINFTDKLNIFPDKEGMS